MKNIKRVASWGLAFSEAADMNMLRRKALRGWHLKQFRFGVYELEQGESEDVIYSIDYRLLEPDEVDEYFEMFSFASWTHVCSDYNMHIFKAKKGTVPIYSDPESALDKTNRLAAPVKKMMIYTVTTTVILWLVMTLTSGIIETISKWSFMFALILAFPATMTYLATLFHRYNRIKRG